MTDDIVWAGPSKASDAFECAVLDALGGESAVAFALYDSASRYMRVSDALARLNRVPAADHQGRRPTELLPSAPAREIEKIVAMVFSHTVPYTETDSALSPPDWYDTCHLQTRWVPVHDADGAVRAVLAIVSDITEHRHREELLRSSQWRTARLQLMTARLAGALSITEVEAVVAELGRGIEAVRAEVHIVEDAAPVFPWPNAHPPRAQRHLRAIPPEWPTPLVLAVRDGIPQYTGGRADRTENADNDREGDALVPAMRTPPDAPADEPCSVVLPLLGSGAPLGAIRFTFREARAFGSDDRVFLEAFAGQCALAVERSRLYEREHRTAVALQRSLLPDRLPDVDGVEFDFRYLPGAPDFEVGGDWYDVFRIPDGRVAIVVGDVIGKGLTAAAGMGRVRTALRALAYTDPDPAAVLTGLDRLFTATEDDESLTTLIYGVIDPETGILELADAGHLPVMIVSAGGKARLADAGPASTPLGVAERRTKHTMRLDPGDILVGFSDGLIENRTRGIDQGLDLILEVGRTATGGLDALLSSILRRLLDGQDRDDDVTVLGVRIVGATTS